MRYCYRQHHQSYTVGKRVPGTSYSTVYTKSRQSKVQAKRGPTVTAYAADETCPFCSSPPPNHQHAENHQNFNHRRDHMQRRPRCQGRSTAKLNRGAGGGGTLGEPHRLRRPPRISLGLPPTGITGGWLHVVIRTHDGPKNLTFPYTFTTRTWF